MNKFEESDAPGSNLSALKDVSGPFDRQQMLRAAVRTGFDNPYRGEVFNADLPLSPASRAAVVFVALGPECGSRLLQNFSPEEAEMTLSMLASVVALPRSLVMDVLKEYCDSIEDKIDIPFDSVNFLSSVLAHFDATNESGPQRKTIRPDMDSNIPFLDILCTIPEKTLHKYLRDEHPQLAAAVLAILPTEMSGKVLDCFEKSERAEIVLRVGKLSPVEKTLLDQLKSWIADIVRKHFIESRGVSKTEIGGIGPAVDLISSLNEKGDVEAVEQLRVLAPEFAAQVESKIFYFDDFANVEQRYLATILRELPRDVLVVAMKGAADHLQQKLFSGMSQRMAEQVRFEMENIVAPRVSQVDECQREMVRIARDLERQQIVILDRVSKQRSV